MLSSFLLLTLSGRREDADLQAGMKILFTGVLTRAVNSAWRTQVISTEQESSKKPAGAGFELFGYFPLQVGRNVL
jgi:hypothetical protein